MIHLWFKCEAEILMPQAFEEFEYYLFYMDSLVRKLEI